MRQALRKERTTVAAPCSASAGETVVTATTPRPIRSRDSRDPIVDEPSRSYGA
jgi:hypothetical protein